MSDLIYGLCMITAVLCASLLLRAYVRTQYRLLLWSGICFAILGLSNFLLVVDMVMLPSGDLSLFRSSLALLALTTLLYGMIFDVE